MNKLAFKNKQALAEGWFVCEMNGTFHIERLDEAAIFGSDVDAIIHVAEQAKSGSEYHRDALEIIGTLASNPGSVM